MFAATMPDGSPVNVRVSFLQCVKAGVAFALGALLIPIAAVAVQAITKIPILTVLALLPRL